MTELVNINDDSNRLLQGIECLIEQTGKQVAVYLNTTISRFYWAIGNHIVTEMGYDFYSGYGTQMFATVSRTLSWSHFIELVAIDTSNLYFER